MFVDCGNDNDERFGEISNAYKNAFGNSRVPCLLLKSIGNDHVRLKTSVLVVLCFYFRTRIECVHVNYNVCAYKTRVVCSGPGYGQHVEAKGTGY